MKNLFCVLLISAAIPCVGAVPVKAKKSEKIFIPTPDIPGYADWDRWQYVTASTSAAKYYAKRISVISPGLKDFWLKVERPAIECPTNAATNSGPTINPFLESPFGSLAREANRETKRRRCENERDQAPGSSITHIIFACKSGKAKYLEQASYNQAGESLDSDDGKDKWVGIIPDTAMEAVFQYVCN